MRLHVWYCSHTKLCRFSRVWVIPEVALAKFSTVAIGKEMISWDHLVRLIRDTQLPEEVGFSKQTALLGNPRQRVAIISQMVASHRENLYHTDITQLLILAKSSEATDLRDKVYAFDGITLLRTQIDYRDIPDHKESVARLYTNTARHYVDSITSEDYYSRWHGLNEQQRNQQLMSILYSAGKLHQHFDLPSWAPDWTFAWYQAPLWCKTESNMASFSGRDVWSSGIRGDFRAGGDERETFEFVDNAHGRSQLRLSVLIVDQILEVSEVTPAPTPTVDSGSPHTSSPAAVTLDSPTYSYGRDFFTTTKGLQGMATSGIRAGDDVVVLLGGDVPVVMRRVEMGTSDDKVFHLLCECYVQSDGIMNGELLRTNWTGAEDVVLK
jgi:hypothetical protein